MSNMAVCQNLVPLVNIKIAGKWMFIPLKMVLIGIDPYPYQNFETTDLMKRMLHRCTFEMIVGCFWCKRRCVYAGRQPHGVSFHCTSACETIMWIQYQWFGLRENLQETIHFPRSMEFSCKCPLKP